MIWPLELQLNVHLYLPPPLQGLAIGFVLLRVESLVEEGKL